MPPLFGSRVQVVVPAGGHYLCALAADERRALTTDSTGAA